MLLPITIAFLQPTWLIGITHVYNTFIKKFNIPVNIKLTFDAISTTTSEQLKSLRFTIFLLCISLHTFHRTLKQYQQCDVYVYNEW